MADYRELLRKFQERKQSEFDAIAPQEQAALAEVDQKNKDYQLAQMVGKSADMLNTPSAWAILKGRDKPSDQFASQAEMLKPEMGRKDVLAKFAALKQGAQGGAEKAELAGIDAMADEEKSKRSSELEMAKFNRQQDWDVKKLNMANQFDINKIATKAELDAKDPSKQFDRLPEDKKLTVKELATGNAKLGSIVNDLDIGYKQFMDPKLSQDQKIKVGQSLLKTINSAYGADAIGTEEANRIGSLLEYQILNLTNPGPAFGRDLNAFAEQLKNKSDAFKQRMTTSQAQIDSILGRSQQQASAQQSQSGGGLAPAPNESLSPIPSANASKPGGRVIVSDGKETFEIDESDLPGAEKDGFKRIR